jgi:tetratricopeptide (TPR) repeat protein
LTIDESHQRAEPHAELALSLAPNLAEAHGAVGFVRWTQGRLDEARKHFEDALRLNPSYSNVYVWLSSLLGNQGYYAEEFSMRKLNLRIDPLSIPAASNLIFSLVQRHDFEEARKHLRQLQTLSGPAYGQQAFVDLMELGWAAGLSDYLTSYRTSQARRFHVRSRITWLLFVIGLEDEALAFIDPPSIWILNLAGRHDEAFAISGVGNSDSLGSSVSHAGDTEMGWVLASDGNYVDALPWMRQYWRIARGRTQAFHIRYGEWMYATALIQASLAVGSNNTDIDVILDAMDAAVRRNRSAGIIGGGAGEYPATAFVAALAALQSGDREKGFAYLDTAVDVGEYIPLNFEFLRFIYDDPKFAPILAKQEANQAREREKFLSVVCSDNPNADVWVPMESTCSDYAAANVN